MIKPQWKNAGRKYIVCVDSYDDGILKGRIWDHMHEAESFHSLSQFLLKMEELLDEEQMPQAYTIPRKFSETPPLDAEFAEGSKKGEKATFELKVIFRRNTTWQGILVWREDQKEHSFRSVLELVILMDSALRGEAGIRYA